MSPKKRECLDNSLQDASPRSGGYVPYTALEHTTEDEPPSPYTYTNDSTSEGNTRLESDWETTDDYQLDDDNQQAPSARGQNRDEGSVNVLANLISVVMILASGKRPPPVEMRMAIDYLNYIKDEEGNSPPNVQGLLNHIEYLGLNKF